MICSGPSQDQGAFFLPVTCDLDDSDEGRLGFRRVLNEGEEVICGMAVESRSTRLFLSPR